MVPVVRHEGMGGWMLREQVAVRTATLLVKMDTGKSYNLAQIQFQETGDLKAALAEGLRLLAGELETWDLKIEGEEDD